jgi:hypothetical protein
MLLDSESMSLLLTPEFARVAKLEIFELENLITLHLGYVGSQSKINFGAYRKITMGLINAVKYFNIVNIDHFDGIVGVMFLCKHCISLDFAFEKVYVDGIEIPILKE